MRIAGWIILLLTAWTAAYAGKYDEILKFPLVPFGISKAEVEDRLGNLAEYTPFMDKSKKSDFFFSDYFIAGILFNATYDFQDGLLHFFKLVAVVDKTDYQSMKYIYRQFYNALNSKYTLITNIVQDYDGKGGLEKSQYLSKDKSYKIYMEFILPYMNDKLGTPSFSIEYKSK
jgi:hypothetical protein